MPLNDFLFACTQVSQWAANRDLSIPVSTALKKEDHLTTLVQIIEEGLNVCIPLHESSALPSHALQSETLKAVAWNIDRGKGYESIVTILKNHPQLLSADLYFLNEVDWGMARSENRNITAELGRLLNCFAYFVPSHFNFTKGHRCERDLPGKNKIGLSGLAILSRFPLENLRVIAITENENKMDSKEARLGQERALTGNLAWQGKKLAVVGVHLEAFSSPRMRALQLKKVVTQINGNNPVLIAGDWNTNTLNATSGFSIFSGIVKQLVFKGSQAMLYEHHPYPEKYYDRVLFEMLKESGFETENCNEPGVGSYGFFSTNEELRRMVSDVFPPWTVRFIRWLGEKFLCSINLKLDWFAARNLKCLEAKVVRLKAGDDYPIGKKPSDHLPITASVRLD